MTLEQYRAEAQAAVTETAEAFHLVAPAANGERLVVPCSYQIREASFRPFQEGKASPEELQSELDRVIGHATAKCEDLGLESEESLNKLLVQLGLGIDCSNFAYRSLSKIHERLGIGNYTNFIFRPSKEIYFLYEKKGSWVPTDAQGNERTMYEGEFAKLKDDQSVSIGWIVDVFGKDPEYIIGSHHMTGEEAASVVAPEDVLPGDLVAFKHARNERVSHVAVVDSIHHYEDEEGAIFISFWHSWHSRDFESGLRQDNVVITNGGQSWSHEGLADPHRYQDQYFCRPIGMAALVESLA